MKNYYSILGVTPDSSEAEIKSAYRRLARKFHPDVNPDGASRFKDISEAYETLSDAKKRFQYDTINGFFKSSSYKKEKQQTSPNEAQNQYKKTSTNSNSTDEEKSVYSSKTKMDKQKFSKKINDIFEGFTNSKKEKPLPVKGADIYEEISISIKEAINGTERMINVVHAMECPHCKGRKFINGNVCPICNGSGEKTEHRNGGKNGDLFLKIKIEPNSRISFDGNNIVYNIPITPVEAVLGGKISVPAFDGNFSLKIPPKTHSGQKFRLAGQGLKQNGKIGDMIVNVHIEIPCSLSDDEVRLYEKLKKLSTQNIRENLLNE